MSNYVQKPLKMDEIGHIAILRETPSLKILRLLNFTISSDKMFRINLELNYELSLLIEFLK